VRVGGAGSFPVILEDLDVHDSAVRGEVVITLAVCAQDLFDMAIVQRREMTVMVGGLDDDLVRPDAVDAHERPVPMLADFPGPFERRNLFGTQRIDQLGPSGFPPSRYARTSGGVMVSWPSQNGQLSFGVASFEFRKAPGRWERAAEKTTHVGVA